MWRSSANGARRSRPACERSRRCGTRPTQVVRRMWPQHAPLTDTGCPALASHGWCRQEHPGSVAARDGLGEAQHGSPAQRRDIALGGSPAPARSLGEGHGARTRHQGHRTGQGSSKVPGVRQPLQTGDRARCQTCIREDNLIKVVRREIARLGLPPLGVSVPPGSPYYKKRLQAEAALVRQKKSPQAKRQMKSPGPKLASPATCPTCFTELPATRRCDKCNG